MIVAPGSQVVLQGQGSDPGGDTVGFSWTQIQGPQVALSDPSRPNPSFVAPLAGDAELAHA